MLVDKMSFSLCSSSVETPNPFFGRLHFANMNVPCSRPFSRLGKKDDVQIMWKAALSNHLTCEHLQGSVVGKKQLGEGHQKVEHVRTLLIDNYDSYTYNIYQELCVINGVPPFVVRNDDWTWKEAYYYLYEERAFDNIVISPGPGSPTCLADIGLCLQLLLECWDIPILGVCLGHQALGYVHGAQIVHASEPVHGRLSEIEHNSCRLFNNIPSGKNSGFKVVRYHSLVIDGNSLPKELVPIAWTTSNDALTFFETSSSISDAYRIEAGRPINHHSMSTYLKDGSSSISDHVNGLHDGTVLMGIMHSARPHYGLQFHPESVATSYGRQMFKNFRDITVDYWLRLATSSTKHRHGRPLRSLRGGSVANNENKGCNYLVRNMVNTPITSIDVRNLKLKWRKLDCLASQVGGTRNIFCEMYGECKAEDTFWLDSSSVEKGRAHFSIMGGRGGSLWKRLSFRLSDQSDVKLQSGGLLFVEDVQGFATSLYLKDGFLDFLNKELHSFCCNKKDYDGLPFDFCGGYIGYIGYNLKVETGAAFNRHKSSSPDACFFFADNFIVIDDHCGDVYIMSLYDNDRSPLTWLEDAEQRLLNLKASAAKNVQDKYPQSVLSSPFQVGFVPEKSRAQYIEDVEKCLQYIKDGESYELCLTTQMRRKFETLDPLNLYLSLRERNPAPYAAWLNFAEENLCVCCSSPERFLRLDRNGILEAKPIKGTISRGSSPENDEHLKARLQYSEKDRAENLMIVDLLRNDLGRVCEPGSVHVPHLMEVETYATVHTMVSTIRGKRRPDVSPVDCVRAAFPGGSMTGAPKLRSMEILDSLESCSRGIYSGSIGYFSINSTFDLNIVIRTIVVHEGKASIGAGGAVVALSKPEDEYDEMILKTQAPVRAILDCEAERLYDM
ncbi:hypothetical protein Nepgr_001227 [Nepenthes gracilis]|uniref:aminodeoxychorismate synthase n=1 Tax=Nepenthes gracilis TaxID=150966 RepID=A0AAD3RXE5_NEPGR|nr:hypothetical protein Nepgr_001227 [Nepenthes gracilis]